MNGRPVRPKLALRNTLQPYQSGCAAKANAERVRDNKPSANLDQLGSRLSPKSPAPVIPGQAKEQCNPAKSKRSEKQFDEGRCYPAKLSKRWPSYNRSKCSGRHCPMRSPGRRPASPHQTPTRDPLPWDAARGLRAQILQEQNERGEAQTSKEDQAHAVN